MTPRKQNLVARRPAESVGTVAGAVTVLICALLHVEDPTVYGALLILVGAIPAGVTWIVGLVRGG